MSEDTTAKPGPRRRRTTRAGRRRAGRPGEGQDTQPPGGEERWTPAWEPQLGAAGADPETLPGDALEELEDGEELGEEGEGDCSAADAAEPPVAAPVHASDASDDARNTVEMMVSPFTRAQLQQHELPDADEKTNPRVRLSDLEQVDYGKLPEEPPSTAPPVHIWSRPSSRRSHDDAEQPVVAVRQSVIIATSQIIGTPRVINVDAAERAVSPPPPRATASTPALSPPPPPPAETIAARAPATPAAAAAAPPAAAGADEASAFESFGDALAEAPAVVAAAAATPDAGADEVSVPLVDVDVSEIDAARSSRTPPPPPPDARAKLVPPKRPPPPPAPPPAKLEDERSKRKQVRQWWERFFSDDYLMSVIAPTQAQMAKQVDFIEQSLGIPKGGTILDVGCGLGLHSVELTRRGYLVVGLDLSLAMITRAAELAQQQQLKLNVVHADIREMEFDGAFDGVICMGTTFGFFDDDANRDVLARLFQALRPGGRVLLDTVNRDNVISSQPNLVWYEGDECVCMEESDFNYFNSRLTVKRTLMREDGRQSQAEYSVRLYSLHELGLMMQQVGFRVIEVSGQEAIRGAFFGASSPRVLMLAERRAPGRPSAVMPSGELPRVSAAFPPERGSSEVPKITRSD